MRIVTAQEMQRLEQEAHADGMSYEAMMDKAGHAVARVIQTHLPLQPGSVLILVGPGNNGGDGLVAGHYLVQMGCTVAVYLWRREPDTLLERAIKDGANIMPAAKDPDCAELATLACKADVIIDALLGTGAKGPLRGALPHILKTIRTVLVSKKSAADCSILDPAAAQAKRVRPLVVAVDLPSGLDTDTGQIDSLALPADMTVAFASPKRGHLLFPGAAYVGKLLVADIGISTDGADGPLLMNSDLVADWLPRRSLDSHKGTFGKAMVVAGSANYVGAPSLAAQAAYRVGAGLVTLGLATAIYPLVAANLREATYLLLPSEMGALVADAVRILAQEITSYDALLVGPGLGSAPSTEGFMTKLLAPKRAAKQALGFSIGHQDELMIDLPPLVIDADGLNLLGSLPSWWEMLPDDTVLTPHPGEMARLTGLSISEVQAQRWQLAADRAQAWGCTVVLKGAHTVVATPGWPLLVSPFATPALATAGTGDVLAGMIVGLVAQGMEPYQAAGAAVYLHGLAGQLAERELGKAGMLASELQSKIPLAQLTLRQQTT